MDKLIKSTSDGEKWLKNYKDTNTPNYGKEFFVATNGNDSNPGTINKPFATLQKARDEIRKYKKTNPLPDGGIVVWIRGGIYSFPKSFILNKQDSGEKGKPIVYRSYNHENVRLTGGIQLNSNWFQPVTSKDPAWSRLNANARSHIQVLDLKAHGITDLGKLTENARFGSNTPMELFEDDKALTLARWPDKDATTTYLPTSRSSQIIVYGDLKPNVTGTYIRQDSKSPVFKRNGLVDGKQYYISRVEGKTTNDSRSWIISKNDNKPLWIHSNGGYNPPREFVPYYHGGTGIPSLLKPNSKQYGFAFTKEGLNDTSFKYSEDNPSQWKNTGDIWINGMLQYAWRNNHTKIKSIDPDKKIINLTEKPIYGIKKGKYKKAYYAYNILEELTTPGEYYIDRKTYKLYVWPEKNVKNSQFSVSINNHIVIYLANASWIELNDLTMEIARERVCVIANGEYNLITNSKLQFSGKSLLEIYGKNNGITYSELTGAGNDAVYIHGGERSSLTPSNNFVINNNIHHNGRWNWTSKEAVTIYGIGNIVKHNNIHDFMHQAIQFSGNNNIIEYNNIYNALTYAEDAGVIYGGNRWDWRGNKINYNFIHDIQNNYGGSSIFGLYFDDTRSGSEAIGNIFYNIDGYGVFMHDGRDNIVENNIFDNVATAYIGTNHAASTVSTVHKSRKNLLERMSDDGVNYKSEPWLSAYPRLAAMPNNWDKIKSGKWLYPGGNSFQNNIGVNYLSWYRGPTKDNFKYYAHFDEKPINGDDSKFKTIPFDKIGIEKK